MTENRHRVVVFGLCVAVSACATTTYSGPGPSGNRVGQVMEQPLRDISWMREEPPEILKQAALKPYELAEGVPCGELTSEIAALDLFLGADIDAYDANEESGVDAGGLAIDAVSDVFGLPFRGVLRWISGAGKREKVLANAILSGLARRSFLKGVARGAHCTHTPDPEPELR